MSDVTPYYDCVKEIYSRCKSSDWVYDEVISEFIKYRQNHPEGDMKEQMESAFRATAHE